MPPSFVSFPCPAELLSPSSVNPRGFKNLLPLEDPPVVMADYPAIPGRPSLFNGGSYTISTHVFPAAYPRAPSCLLQPPHPDVPLNKAQIEGAVKYLSSRKEAQEDHLDIWGPRRDVLWNTVNRYVRRGPSRLHAGPPITLLMLHGIGAHKEAWEPVISRLLENVDQTGSTLNVEEIWCLDLVQHGDSALLNESVLSDVFDCAELARDVANFLLYYLPSASHENVATNLQRLPQGIAQTRRIHGFHTRNLVGVGHSVSACTLVYPAHDFPALFRGLVLIEPVSKPESLRHVDAHRKFEAMCLGRRGAWKTREQAEKAITTGLYYRSWAPSTIQTFLQHALIQTADSKWKLKTHPWHEAVMLFERLIVYETWELLASLSPRIPVHWVWGGTSQRSGGPSIQAQTSWRHAGTTGSEDSNICLQGIGHLVPQEAPEKLGDCLFAFLEDRFSARPYSDVMQTSRSSRTLPDVAKL